MKYAHLPQSDPDVFRMLQGEAQRELEGLELIPSENYVTQSVLEALGSVMTNKYSEGTPGRRYYGGQTVHGPGGAAGHRPGQGAVRADHANVQPMSGAAANLCVYAAWLDIGDTVLAMDHLARRHLTHGAPVTFAAKAFSSSATRMKDVSTGAIDYDELESAGPRAQAQDHPGRVLGLSRELNYRRMRDIAEKVGAMAMADMAHIAGLIAARRWPIPSTPAST
jgi:glycine hydroxymethyltransferase